jgi:putative transposase
MVYRSCRHRVYPNQKQEKLFRQFLGNARFIHNNVIGEIEYNRRIANLFNARDPYVNRSYAESIFNYLRVWYPFINDLDINTMQSCYKPVLMAYDNFFKRGFGHPKFKKKNQSSQSVKINNINNRIRIKEGKLCWKPFGRINLKGFRPEIAGKIKHIRLQLKNSQWFIIVLYDSPLPDPWPKTGKEVGIDLGVKTLATLSDRKAKTTLKLNETEAKIKKTQKDLKRKEHGSKNYKKTLKTLHKHINKQNNIKREYYHKISKDLVKEYDTIKMENLNLKEMMLDHDYSKGLQKASLGMLKNMIKYKCELYGKTFIEVPRYYPSSQICHVCGYRNTNLTIKEREWQCPNCGAILDRDLNASINILNYGK